MNSTMKWTSLAILLGALSLMSPVSLSEPDSAMLQAESLSDNEKLQFGKIALEEMETSVKEVSKMLEVAEREKESSRIQCLSKKLTTMRALLEVSQGSKSSMDDAIDTGDQVRSAHEYRKLSIALTKIRQFKAEAEACAGGQMAQPGSTEVQVYDEFLTEEEGGDIDGDDLPDFWDPISTSRFQ